MAHELEATHVPRELVTWELWIIFLKFPALACELYYSI
jgi:hypothetical protein